MVKMMPSFGLPPSEKTEVRLGFMTTSSGLRWDGAILLKYSYTFNL